jgi:hypothetical protein
MDLLVGLSLVFHVGPYLIFVPVFANRAGKVSVGPEFTAPEEAVLNHAKKGMVKVYNLHQYDNEKKAALIKLEKEIIRIVGKPNYRLLTQFCSSL